MVLERLNVIGANILNHLTLENKSFERYARMWVAMYDEYKNNPNAEYRMLFNASSIKLYQGKKHK